MDSTEERLRAALEAQRRLIEEVHGVLNHHIVPDSGSTDKDAMCRLYSLMEDSDLAETALRLYREQRRYDDADGSATGAG